MACVPRWGDRSSGGGGVSDSDVDRIGGLLPTDLTSRAGLVIHRSKKPSARAGLSKEEVEAGDADACCVFMSRGCKADDDAMRRGVRCGCVNGGVDALEICEDWC